MQYIRPSSKHSFSKKEDADGEKEDAKVDALSTKLVESVEKQAALEDQLARSQHGIGILNKRIEILEAKLQEHADALESGKLIERKDADLENETLIQKLMEESKQRVNAEQDKRVIEQEVEDLTRALFEEANKLVATARMDRERAEKRIEQLLSQINDKDALLETQQSQLVELKELMQKIEDEAQGNDPPSLHPTPKMRNVSGFSTNEIYETERVYRIHVPGFQEFSSFIRMAQPSLPVSDPASPSLALNPRSGDIWGPALNAQGSSPSFSPNQTSPSVGSFPGMASNPSSFSHTPLKEWRFVKRCISEDIDPTLRLDLAPGLSWLNRRSIFQALMDFQLLVEPLSQSSSLLYTSCTLCGDNNPGQKRDHYFSTANSSSSQIYPVCTFCLERLRSVCDLIAFLRTIRDGLWKVGGIEGVEKAWDECVRLRERCFWARIGLEDSPLPLEESPQPISSQMVDGKNEEDQVSCELDGQPNDQNEQENDQDVQDTSLETVVVVDGGSVDEQASYKSLDKEDVDGN